VKKLNPLLFLLLLLLALSCAKHADVRNTPGSEIYPNTIGDSWIYSYTSFDGSKRGTLEVRIAIYQTSPEGPEMQIWIYKYSSVTDTLFKDVTNRFVSEYNFPLLYADSMNAYRELGFPLISGKKWAAYPSSCADSLTIFSLSPLTVPAGTFDSTYQVNVRGSECILNYSNTSSTWYTPHIGMVKMIKSVRNLTEDPRNGLYQLIEYHLK